MDDCLRGRGIRGPRPHGRGRFYADPSATAGSLSLGWGTLISSEKPSPSASA